MAWEDEASSLPDKLKKTTISPHSAMKINKDIAKYFEQSHTEAPDTWISKPWTLKPEFPSSDEIFGEEDNEFVDLAPNNIDGPWESKEAYLKAHYDLIREDAVAPLRDAVAIFRNDPDMGDDKHICIYEKVYMIGLTFSRRGLGFQAQFSTIRAGRNIAWEYSKRLVSGSIVALSPADDAFQTKCVIAIVAARPLDGVKAQPPKVDIFFADLADADFDPQLEWVMIQAKEGYYESARHTMTALQKMSRESFPLAAHICLLNKDVNAPEYVRDNPVIGIGSAMDDAKEENKVDILNAWPHTPVGDLDTTQWAAIEQMLTKQLAVIQGPPVVASQTNHALDQILTHISRFEKQYVRLGSRSSDTEIKKRTLYSIRRDEPMPIIPGSTTGSAHRTSKALFNSISQLLQPFHAANSHAPLPSSVFQKYKLLTAKQCESLEKRASRWVTAGEDSEDIDPLVTWIGEQVVPFGVSYAMESFGFPETEVDLEYEQLKELEAEMGFNDDDEYGSLKGPYINIGEGYCGRTISPDGEAASWEYLEYDDMWEIPAKDRGWVYNELRSQLKTKILSEFRQLLVHYSENCRSLQIGAWERDTLILQNAKVIGMTTTGLSKYRALVASVKPKIILIEEAAEAIEAPITAACLDSLQQLILVGDHQQLRGHCTVKDLEGDPFYLDISMFERLVRNGMKHITLQRQRRMAPEIRGLLAPIYGPLEDHESVKNREGIPGMGDIRVFFVSHGWAESFDDMASKYNEKEAEMVVGFFVYLVLNNVPVKDITILTFYNGQRKKILKLMKAHPYLQGHYVKVVTVDSYQGEENEVVILSLVRNGLKGIGFLSIANRVCVALSRARRGFYMFGNAELLARTDKLWAQVLFVLGNKSAVPRAGHALPLTCVKHKNKTYVKDPSDWRKVNGGCELACGETLQCGHKCTVLCHSFSHDQIECTQICNRRMACNHMCKTPCKESHICSCNCGKSRRLESLAIQPADAGARWVVAQTEDKRDSVKRAAIAKYQAYANGGSKGHDEALDHMAESQWHRNQPTDPDICLLSDRMDGATPMQAVSLAKNGGTDDRQEKLAIQPQRSLFDYW
ncbi:P-loop containing nucleoside triphosphate hydrolase protein [Aspergillus granulosus]|uniref:P-loop containing nucleoside triphosphate hydrolase protein n=1 Tax=Aspergillus granulosus TaxID=176169 RepID=A0ABR4HC59_9EURO